MPPLPWPPFMDDLGVYTAELGDGASQGQLQAPLHSLPGFERLARALTRGQMRRRD